LNLACGDGKASARDAASRGFPPVIGSNAKVLILGSLPSRQSLRMQEYYANPRNAFWRIMGEIGALDDVANAYGDRCNALINNRIALWDVLASSVRPGSLDSAIDLASAKENDFSGLLAQQQGIMLICFNGMKARQLFDRLVLRSMSVAAGCELIDLPSSSPAHAAMSFEKKLERWLVVGRYIGQDDRPCT
jgi:double-stranded uracil-DNA glycosylase